jgi:antitoxin HicB
MGDHRTQLNQKEKKMAHYYAQFTPADEGGFVVTFRDLPEAITQGDTLEEAREMAEDAVLTALEFYFDDNRLVPAPSPAQAGEYAVELPISVWAKVLLLNEMVEQHVGPSELSRRLNTTPQNANKLINLKHATKIDIIEKALRALGKSLLISTAYTSPH